MYLMIRNLGVADHRGFTLLGVSTTRNSGLAGTVGQFGSGAKHSLALLLRNNINPIIFCGNLRMEFFTKNEDVKGQIFRRVCVKYSGADIDGSTNNRTEDLGFTLEWGVQDWTKLGMAIREFVSNGIDGSIVAGGSSKAVQFDIVEKPRAKQGHTSVYIPYTPEIAEIYGKLDTMFLHFDSPELLNCKCLPKRQPNEDKVLIYKKGVLVSWIKGKSVFDYNLGEELTLDESRNANDYDVKHAVALSLNKENAYNLAMVLRGIIADKDMFEAKLDSYDLKLNTYAKPELQEERKKVFQDVWQTVGGTKSVAVGDTLLSSFVREKGYRPVCVPSSWLDALSSYAVPNEMSILTASERDGKVVSEPTQEMKDCTKKVWALVETFNLTNGKEMPNVLGFASIMDGSSQTFGYYLQGTNDIYLHTSLGGKVMFKVCLEETCHFVSGAGDYSRDIQDWLFALITEMAY